MSDIFADKCLKDSEELRDIAAWFEQRGDKLNADFLLGVAGRHEVLAGAYSTASGVRDAADEFFRWANKTWPDPGGNENHPWYRLARALGYCR